MCRRASYGIFPEPEGNGWGQRPKHLSPEHLLKMGNWDSHDTCGDWASLGLGGCGPPPHPRPGLKLGPLAPPGIWGGRRCLTGGTSWVLGSPPVLPGSFSQNTEVLPRKMKN